MKLARQTEFPLRTWSYPLPRHPAKTKIVKYSDFVQMHVVANFIHNLVEPKAIIDVGAHHGTYALLSGSLLRQKFGCGRVVAIEPNPASFRILEHNVQRNALGDIVTCINACCADRNGWACITDNGSQSQMRMCDGEKVRTVTVDDVIEKHAQAARPGLIVIDVEGAELPVLRGLTLSQHQPDLLLCEMHPKEWPHFGYTQEDMQTFMSANGLVAIDTYFDVTSVLAGEGYVGPCLLLKL
ncbi:MAG: FkbM family methyltransferase [Planctomycetota bacterium]